MMNLVVEGTRAFRGARDFPEQPGEAPRRIWARAFSKK
jgi:hypothetical protein